MRVVEQTKTRSTKERQAELRSEAASLVTRGQQLGLSEQQILAVVRAIIKERKALETLGIARGKLHLVKKREDYFCWQLDVAVSDRKDRNKRERRYVGGDDDADAMRANFKRAAMFDELGRELAAVDRAIVSFETAIRAAIEMAEYGIRRW